MRLTLTSFKKPFDLLCNKLFCLTNLNTRGKITQQMPKNAHSSFLNKQTGKVDENEYI
jgi:hypothetical protein